MLKQLTRARLIWLIAIVLVVLFVLYRCSAGGDDAPDYQTSIVEKTNVVSRVSTSGSLQAVVTVDVGSQVSGRIQELYADFNSTVKKGEKIAKIDPVAVPGLGGAGRGQCHRRARQCHAPRGDGRGRRAPGQARLGSLRAETHLRDRARQRRGHRARRARLGRPGQGPARAVAAALEQARTNLRYTDILSPTDGVVISRAVNVGQTVAASLQAPVIFTIAQDLRKMEVHTNVAESDIGRLKPGMRVSFTVDAYPGEPFRGSIRDIRNAPQVVQNVVTYDAVIDVANDDLKLKPGMTATVSVVTDRRRDVLAVPNAALRFRPERRGGRAASRRAGAAQAGGSARRRAVSAGAQRERGQAQGGQGQGNWRRAARCRR